MLLRLPSSLKRERQVEKLCSHPKSVQGRYRFPLFQDSRGQNSVTRDKGDWFSDHRTCRDHIQPCVCERKIQKRYPRAEKNKLIC